MTRCMSDSIARFYERVVPMMDDRGCWEFSISSPRVEISVNGRRTRAYRFVYEIEHGAIPEGAYLCHKCDNDRCVNPAHLYVGTAKTNMADAIARGRISRGEKHAAIMRAALASEFCVKGHAEWSIVKRKSGRSNRYCKACNRENVLRCQPRKGKVAVS